MNQEKSKKQLTLELGGIFGGVLGIVSIIGSVFNHYDDKNTNVNQHFSTVDKVQAEHEVRIDALERDKAVTKTEDLHFQEQVREDLSKMRSESLQAGREQREQYTRLYELIVEMKRNK